MFKKSVLFLGSLMLLLTLSCSSKTRLINFENMDWQLEKGQKPCQAKIENGRLKIKSEMISGMIYYLWSGKTGSWGAKEKENHLNIEKGGFYEISFQGSKNEDLILFFSLRTTPLEDFKDIFRIRTIKMNQKYYFQALEKDILYKIVFRISGQGQAEIKNIRLTKLTEKEYLAQKSAESPFYTPFYHLSRHFNEDSVFLNKLIEKYKSFSDVLFFVFPDLKDNKLRKREFHYQDEYNQQAQNTPVEFIYASCKLQIKALPFNWNQYKSSFGIDRHLNSLRWLPAYLEKNPADWQKAACLIMDWADFSFANSDNLRRTFFNMDILEERTKLLDWFISSYAEKAENLELEICNQLIKLIMVHLYALASLEFHPVEDPGGLSVSLSFEQLKLTDKYAVLKESEKLRDWGMDKIDGFLAEIFTSEGLYIERGTQSQFDQLNLLLDIMLYYQQKKYSIPDAFYPLALKAYLAGAYLLDNQGKMVPLGNTEHKPPGIKELQKKMNAFPKLAELGQSPSYQSALEEAQFLYTGGEQGQKPQTINRVFDKSGLAVFRAEQSGASSWEEAAVLHFSCLDKSVYQEQNDDFSFTLSSWGRALIIDPGLITRDKYNSATANLGQMQKSARAHNVFLFNMADYPLKLGSNNESKIIESGFSENISWLRAGHQHFKGIGISGLERKLVFYKGNELLIVDKAESRWKLRPVQLFHIHPDFKDYQLIDGKGIIFRTEHKNDPKLLFVFGQAVLKPEIMRGSLEDLKNNVIGIASSEWGKVEDYFVLNVELGPTQGKVIMKTLIKVIAPGEDFQLPDTDYLSALEAKINQK